MVPRARGGSRASRPSSCPLLHTRHSTVCTSGQGRLVTANLASDFAHAIRQRVHKRTRTALFFQSRVRLCTRHKAACARTDRSGAILPVPCPTLHTRGRPVCTNGHVPSPFAAQASACAYGHPGRARMRALRRRDRHPRTRKKREWRGHVQGRKRDPPSPDADASACARRGFSRVRMRPRWRRPRTRAPRVVAYLRWERVMPA